MISRISLSIFHQPSCCCDNISRLRNKRILERRAIWHWSIGRRNPHDGAIESVECLFSNDRSYLAAHTAGPDILVEDDHFVDSMDGL